MSRDIRGRSFEEPDWAFIVGLAIIGSGLAFGNTLSLFASEQALQSAAPHLFFGILVYTLAGVFSLVMSSTVLSFFAAVEDVLIDAYRHSPFGR